MYTEYPNSISELSNLRNEYSLITIDQALDDWFNSNSNILILINDEFITRIDMSRMFPTCNRLQAFRHFKYFTRTER